ncbi:MAG: C/D box methylation guide ribonucleoprotein complex aNOP56 subunit [Asgard group archaeon]|nr:C/D box methylation guide ribonucleoprotein complex aNOP56 subunit [Asgard group archaeon]
MKIYLALSPIGTFALNKDAAIIDARYFPKESQKVAKAFVAVDNEELPSIVKEMLQEHKKDEIVVQNATIANILAEQGFTVNHIYDNAILDSFYSKASDIAVQQGIFPSKEEYRQFIRNTAILLTRERVRSAAERRDRLVVHAIETIDDLDKTLNLFSGRLREFYGMHFPELGDMVENHQTYAKIVGETGDKNNLSKEFLVNEIHFPDEKAEKLLTMREKSMGSPLKQSDLILIKNQAKVIVDLYKQREDFEKWMEQTMQDIAPNLCGVVSPLLGARLISLAGSLRELAVSPSSKIQVLGAEKALYRTIKTGAPPPKHGIIFQDPRLNQSKWWLRGKIARILAGRLAIAARMDFFNAEDKSEKLSQEVNEMIEEVEEKYPNPPPQKKRSKRSHSRRRR